jgi:glycosyltransferase involved in cell wall biosynthesis/tetratricopeptide (TPR) repeat protein
VNSVKKDLRMPLNILHVTAHDHGGAGRAAIRLHRALLDAGQSSRMLVLSRASDDPRVVSMIPVLPGEGPVSCPSRLDRRLFDGALGRWNEILREHPGHSPLLELFSEYETGIDLLDYREFLDADIVHFHWTAGLLDVPGMARACAGKKVVWTLHDMNAFTGGCHYDWNCGKHGSTCGACPLLGSTSARDYANRGFLAKLQAYPQVDLTVATPSFWLSDLARKSALLSGKEVVTIPNSVPLDVFRPQDRDASRRKLGIPVSSKVVVFGCEGLTNPRKGLGLLLQSFARLAEDGGPQPQLCVFGHSGEGLPLPQGSISFGSVAQEDRLAEIFSAADVFVIPSLQDNLPNIVLESLACGTPVAGFSVGGIPDMVQHERTGHLASVGDVGELAKSVRWILEHVDTAMRERCRRTVEEMFSPCAQAGAFMDLYERLARTASKHSTQGSDMDQDLMRELRREIGGIIPRNGRAADVAGETGSPTSEPGAKVSLLRTAKSLLLEGRESEAEILLRRSLREAAFPEAVRALSQMLFEQRRVPEALEVAGEALRKFPGRADLYADRAALFMAAGRTAEAIQDLLHLRAIAPEDPVVKDALERLGHRDAARPDPVPKSVALGGRDAVAPRVSAIVSTYKAERLIRGCLQDLVDQTLFRKGMMEIVVVDSGSPEGEGAIVREFQERHPGIVYMRTVQRETLYAAWNRGVRASRGEFVTNANTDDAHRSDALEILAQSLAIHPQADFAFADNYWTDVPNDVWDREGASRRLSTFPDYHPASSLHWCTLGPHPMWRRSIFDRVGFFDPAYKAAGDFDFQMRCALVGAGAVHVPLPLSLYYQGRECLTFADDTSAREAGETVRRWQQTFPIHRIYAFDPGDREAQAAAWIALGHRCLRSGAPWSPGLAFPGLAFESFLRAVDLVPQQKHAQECLMELARLAEGREGAELQKAIHDAVPLGRGIPAPAEPPPAAASIRWTPDRGWQGFDASGSRVLELPANRPPAVPSSANMAPLASSPVAESTAKLATGSEIGTVRWCGDLFNFGGYARLARGAVAGMMDAGVQVTADPLRNDKNWFAGISAADRSRWTDLLSRTPEPGILVCCDVPRDALGNEQFDQMNDANPGCSKRVGWTMFETDRLPTGWADSLNRLDEVWVPSEFNRRTFADAGVRSDKLHVVPGSVDPGPYLSAPPFALPGHARGTTFLSVFQWTRRKGWDVLLSAWAKAFDPKADVRLVLRCHPFDAPASDMRDIFRRSLEELGLRESHLAPIVLLDDFIPESEMPSLFAAADVFVLPSRGEGWGLPYLEAMAAGKPCIATAWGASLSFLHDGNAWLAAPRELVPVGDAACRENRYLAPDHRWADPDPVQVSELLRRAASNVVERLNKGQVARQDAVSRWTPHRTAQAIAERVEAMGSGKPRALPSTLGIVSGGRLSSSLEKVAAGLRTTSATTRTPTSARGPAVRGASKIETDSVLSVRWEGSQFVHHSLAHVNRALCLRLAKLGHDLSIIPWEPDQFAPGADPDLALLAQLHKAPLEGPCQVHVRQTWPPVLEAPAQGKWVVVQPWEFGSPPTEWIAPFRDQVDEIWAYTEYVKRVYVEAGIPEHMVRVVPLGVDADLFRPGLEPLPGLERDGRLTFLYVGGTIARKGFDVLLNAWRQAFGPSDPVRLVVKAMGGETFYKGQTGEAMVRELNASGTSAPIVYFDRDLSPADLPRVYASGDVLVHPYRGEGFGLPIAEAMASGLPVVLTRGGAADDFCGEDESWGVPARRVPVPGGKVGPFETVAPPWWLEPSVDHLAETLRKVAKDEAGRKAKGESARRRILSGWTWDHAARAAESALREIAAKPIARREGGKPNGVPTVPQNAAAEAALVDLNKILFRAEAAAARGELAEAESATREAVEAHAEQPLAWLARAMILRGLKKFPGASEAIQKSISLKESPEALLESVLIHKVSGQDSRAKAAEKILKGSHSAWLASTRALYGAKGQPWPLDPPAKSVKKSAAPPLKGRR